MIDVKILRENPELIKTNCAKRGYDVDSDALHDLDQQYVKLIKETEDLRAERNRLSKECKTDESARAKVKELKVTLGEKETLMDRSKRRSRRSSPGCRTSRHRTPRTARATRTTSRSR